jgi:hypothetical protein
MIKTKLKNLFGLVVFFLLVFIKVTFYKESKIFFPILLLPIFILKILGTTLRILYEFKIPLTSPINPLEIPYYYLLVATVSIQLTISFFWLCYAELSMFFRIKKQNLEPWVKKRYLILGISSGFFLLNGFILPLIPIEGNYANLPYTIMIAISIFVFSIGNLIGWIMPKRLKKIFNKNFVKTTDIDLSEKELIDKINNQLKR